MIHPTAIIEEDVELGADCSIHAGAIIRRHSILEEKVTVHPYAVIGGDPQYLQFEPSIRSGVRIGAGTTIREHVTINRSIHAGGHTVVGEGSFVMANAHVAHDCNVGRSVVLANNVMLAGHVSLGDFTFVGGGAGIHQFCRIGESVMVGGHASISRDVPPFVVVVDRDDVIGFNLVGLKRRDFSRDAIRELKKAFHTIYFSPGNIRVIAGGMISGDSFKTAEAVRFIRFFEEGKRSFARARRATKETAEDERMGEKG